MTRTYEWAPRTKTCPRCKADRKVTDYYPKKTSRGLRRTSWCRFCQVEKSRAYRKGVRSPRVESLVSPRLVLAAVEAFWKHTGRPPRTVKLCAALGVKDGTALRRFIGKLVRDGVLEWEESAGQRVTRALWPAGLRGHIRGFFGAPA